MRILHSSTKKKQTATQEQVQSEKDCFPYQKAYKNGIIRLADQTYAKMYAVPDTQRSADVFKSFGFVWHQDTYTADSVLQECCRGGIRTAAL